MKTLILLALVLGIPVAAMGANPTLTNFNARHFIVDPLALPTNVITLHLNSEQFDTGGSDITITNVFGPGTTNIFQTFITTNITAVTEYVTNLYVTYLVSSNSISGNIQGTPPHLSMFFPDNFSLSDSIVTQNADTNGVTVNGTGDGSVTLGPTPDSITLAKNGTKLLFAFEPTGTNGIYNFGPDGSVLFNGPLTSELQLNTSLSGTFVDIFSGPSDGAAGGSYFHIQDDNNGIPFLLTQLSPYNNGGSAPYVFDTYTNISAGNLLESKNQTTNLFAISFDGKILVGGSATNLVFVNASNQLVYSNGAPSMVMWDGTHTLNLAVSSSTPIVAGDNFLELQGGLAGVIIDPAGTKSLYPITSAVGMSLGSQSRPFGNGYFNGNIGALLTAGDTTFVDLKIGSQTNSLSGDITFAHATNGLTGVEFTHVRTFYNGSGVNHTVTLSSSWINPDGATITVTNNGIVKLYVNAMGDTSSSGLQTNVMTQFKYFK